MTRQAADAAPGARDGTALTAGGPVPPGVAVHTVATLARALVGAGAVPEGHVWRLADVTLSVEGAVGLRGDPQPRAMDPDRTQVYALGVLCVALLRGGDEDPAPRTGGRWGPVLDAIGGEAGGPRGAVPDALRVGTCWLRDVLSAALADDPDERPELDAWAAELDVVHGWLVGPAPGPWRRWCASGRRGPPPR